MAPLFNFILLVWFLFIQKNSLPTVAKSFPNDLFLLSVMIQPTGASKCFKCEIHKHFPINLSWGEIADHVKLLT